MVEMAGIEPASEKFDLQTSTSLAYLFSVSQPGAPMGWVSRCYPMAPERASLAAHIGVCAEHVGRDVAHAGLTDEKTQVDGFLV